MTTGRINQVTKMIKERTVPVGTVDRLRHVAIVPPYVSILIYSVQKLTMKPMIAIASLSLHGTRPI